MNKSAIVIDLDVVKENHGGFVHFDFALTPEHAGDIDFGGDFSLAGNLYVSLDAALSGGECIVRGRLSVPVKGRCARCLTETSLDIEEAFDYCFTEKKLDIDDKRERSMSRGDESFVISDLDGNLDVYPQVRESLILALPQRLLCSKNCKGLCPECGVNLNEETCCCSKKQGDPRMSILESLIEK